MRVRLCMHACAEVIQRYSGLDRPWVPDVVGRAWGNRGNARSRQGKLEQVRCEGLPPLHRRHLPAWRHLAAPLQHTRAPSPAASAQADGRAAAE